MPTYQYACTEASCGHRFEAVQSFSDSALTSCPVCSGGLRKVFSSVGVVFKGSGFYRTDSRGPEKKSDKPSSEPAKGEAKKAESTSTSKSSSSDSSGSAGSSSKATAGSSSGSGTTAKAAAP